MADWLKELRLHLPQTEIREREPLREHTSFHIGGPADAMLFPKTEQQLRSALSVLRELSVPVRLLGAGTNVLAPDDGVRGAVICLKGALCGIRRLGETDVEAYAGETLAHLASFARDASLSGLTFAHGIPGTVGGGLYMNAGAYGGELCRTARSVTVLSPDGIVREEICSEKTFGYRTSVFQSGDWIIRAVFHLTPGDRAAIGDEMQELAAKRRASQPLEFPSAGSAFKRPPNGYAAALIDEAGLKGFRIGDAAVSEKHAGFVVNLGSATAKDVLAVLEHVKDTVKSRTGIELTPEVRIWE